MAEAAEALERDEDLNLDNAAEGERQDTETPENQEPPEGDAPAPEPEEDDFEITFGDGDEPPAKGDNSDLAKHLRAEIRKRDEELAKLRAAVPAPKPVDPGPKPTLEGCDYDGDKFEQELDAWKDRKRQAEQVTTQAQQAQQAEAERFQQRLQVYGDGKTALKVKDFDVAETAVTSTLSAVQQAVALKAAKEPAKLIYALGRHPQKLAEVAKINDPIEFAVAVRDLEREIKVTQRKAPDPDTPIRGSGQFAPRTDPVLEKLEREAAKTGDRTAVVKYKREQAAKAKK